MPIRQLAQIWANLGAVPLSFLAKKLQYSGRALRRRDAGPRKCCSSAAVVLLAHAIGLLSYDVDGDTAVGIEIHGEDHAPGMPATKHGLKASKALFPA